MVSVEAQIRATQKRRQAAMNLSAACVEALRIPDQTIPVVRLYDITILEQDTSTELNDLLDKLS